MKNYSRNDGITTVRTFSHVQKITVQGTSPRGPNGKIIQRPNNLAFTRQHFRYGRFAKPPFVSAATAAHNYGEITASSVEGNTLGTKARAECINQVIAELRSIHVNALDIFRTRRETADMAATAARRLAQGYNLLRKRKFRKFCDLFGMSYKKPKRKDSSTPELWLEYSYGWAPLISDVHTALTNSLKVPQVYFRKVVRFEEPIAYKRNESYVRTSQQGTLKARAVYQGWVSCDPNVIQALSQYGITNPSVTMWEALPFSFVVDWFTPVGSYLESLGTFPGIEVINPSLTTTVHEESSILFRKRDSTSDPWSSADSATYYSSTRSKNRVTSVDLVFTYPSVTDSAKVGLKRFSYALSLLAATFARKK